MRGWGRLCNTLGDLGAPLWYLGRPVCHPWVHFGVFLVLLGTSGEHFGTLGLHLGTLGLHFGALLALWGAALDPLGHFGVKGSKKVPKVTENGRQNRDIFDDILSFRGKWQIAFGSSRLDRIGV